MFNYKKLFSIKETFARDERKQLEQSLETREKNRHFATVFLTYLYATFEMLQNIVFFQLLKAIKMFKIYS